jgi:hypothetical protein
MTRDQACGKQVVQVGLGFAGREVSESRRNFSLEHHLEELGCATGLIERIA